MSGPSEADRTNTKSQWVRKCREEGAQHRLAIARLLREDSTLTNLSLASMLGIHRNTVCRYRKANMEQLHKSTLDETEQMRFEMVERLEHLNKECELHRSDGKLPVGVIHEVLLVTRSMIELLGVRKAVVERLEVKKHTVSFRTFIGKEDQGKFEMTTKQLALKAGEAE